MPPDFEQLLQIIRVTSLDYDPVYVVLASGEDFTFLQVTRQLREKLQEAIRQGYVPLGLLAWEIDEGQFQAHKMFFRWHEEELADRFDLICEAGVDSVGQTLEDHRRHPK